MIAKAILTLIISCPALAGVMPVSLRCEHLIDPVGIDVSAPRLSWRMEDPEHLAGRKQSAYQVLAASTREGLERDESDLWDSGKVVSDQSHLVPYAGKPLGSRAECHWKVRLAGVTMSVRFTSPRIFIFLSSSPAMTVLPAPGSSASRKRTRGSLMK